MVLGLVVWMALAVLAAYAVERLWISLLGGRVFRWALAPGVIVHELSHIVGCLITGATITRARLFSAEGGSVTHAKPRVPVIGEAIIALMPLVGCTVALWLAWSLLGRPIRLTTGRLPELNFSSWSMHLTLWSIRDFAMAAGNLLRDAFGQVYSRRTLTFEGLGFLYLLITFSIAMAPSSTDIKRALVGLLVALIVVGLLQWLGLWGATGHRVLQPLWSLFTFAMMMLSMALAVSVPVAAVCKIAGK